MRLGQPEQCPGSDRGRYSWPDRQPGVEPASALGKVQVPADKPESALQRARQTQEPFPVTLIQGMGQGGPDVVPIGCKSMDPGSLVGAAFVGLLRLGDTDEMGQMTVPQLTNLRSRHLIERELADRLEHPEPRLAIHVPVAVQYAFVDEIA